jgi:hypothetical protein
MPENVGFIDLMLSIPDENFAKHYAFMQPLLKDAESRKDFEMPAQYMFEDIPQAGKQDDYIACTLSETDAHGIEKAMIGVADGYEISIRALDQHPGVAEIPARERRPRSRPLMRAGRRYSKKIGLDHAVPPSSWTART